MRTFIFIMISFFSIDSFSQETDSIVEIIDPIEILAEFPGGMDSLWCFIETRLNYDKLNLKEKKGKIFTSFVIDTTGNVTKIEINPEYVLRFKELVHDAIIENEIKRVLGQMPKWTPAMILDRKVPMSFTLPIKIPYTVFKCLSTNNDTSIYWNVDTLPDFKFGNDSTLRGRINEFLFSQLKWPSDADCIGTDYVQVVVEKNGSLSNFKLLRGFCKEFDDEAMRVVKLMPQWTPAKKGDETVRSFFVIPVRFVLN
jgi:hypothetical protein